MPNNNNQFNPEELLNIINKYFTWKADAEIGNFLPLSDQEQVIQALISNIEQWLNFPKTGEFVRTPPGTGATSSIPLSQLNR